MTNKFLCGRLVTNKDGTVKKVLLADGGGTRDCTISHIDMGFDEIHDRLREIFSLDRNRTSKIYDFHQKELDQNRYTTFYDYVQKNGLKFKATLLYLATPTDDETNFNTPSPEKRTTTIITQPVRNTIPVMRNVSQAEADSSTPPIIIKADDDDDISPIDNDPVLNRLILENLRISSFSNYSFEKSLNEFIDYLRNLINQYNRETVLIQLFEHICTIRGLASIILDRLKQERHSVNEHLKSFYDDGLEKVDKLVRSIKALIELNKMKLSHMDQHSIINNSFNQFQQNFNTLREEWTNKSKASHRHHTSYSSTNYSVDPPPTTPFASSSSTRYHSDTNTRKRSRFSSRSPHHHSSSSSSSSHRRPTDDYRNDKYYIFKQLLEWLNYFLDILRRRRFTSFSFLLEEFIVKIQNCQSNINFSDYRSLRDAENLIKEFENRLTNRMNDEYRHAAPHKVHEDLQRSFDGTLDSVRYLLNSLHDYQTKLDQQKRSRRNYHHHHRQRSSPEEQKPILNKSVQEKSSTDYRSRDDDDQSSEASHSSVGDEQLMEVARNAYEQLPNRSK